MTRKLSAAEFGTVEVMNAFADAAILLLGLGLAETLRRGREGAAGGLALLWAGLGGLALQAGAAPLGGLLGAAAEPVALRLLLAAVAVEAVLLVPFARLRRDAPARLVLGLAALRAVAQPALTISAVSAGYGVPGVMAAALATGLIGAAGLAFAGQGTAVAASPRHWPDLLREGAPVLAGGLGLFALGAFARLALAHAVPLPAIAQYGAAGRIALIAAMLFELLRGRGNVAWVGAAVGLAGMGLARLGLPAGYEDAAALVPLLVLAEILREAGNRLDAGPRPGTALGAAALALPLYAVLVPGFGIAGALAALLAGQGARLLALTLARRSGVVEAEIEGAGAVSEPAD
jgi:hypothetical protein